MHSTTAAHHHQRYLYGILMAAVGSMLFSGKAILVKLAFGYGANSSFVHQMADESVNMQELLISPLRLEPVSSLPRPIDLFGSHAGARKNSTGLDLSVQSAVP